MINAINALGSELDDVATQMTFNGKTIASNTGASVTFRVAGTASSDAFAVQSSLTAAGSISIATSAGTPDSSDITDIQGQIDAVIGFIANTGSK